MMNRDLVLLGDLGQGLGVASRHGVNRFILVIGARKGHESHGFFSRNRWVRGFSPSSSRLDLTIAQDLGLADQPVVAARHVFAQNLPLKHRGLGEIIPPFKDMHHAGPAIALAAPVDDPGPDLLGDLDHPGTRREIDGLTFRLSSKVTLAFGMVQNS